MKDPLGRELKAGGKVILRGTVRSVADTGDPNTETVTFVTDVQTSPGKELCFYLRPGQVEVVPETPGVKETPPTDPAGFIGKGAESLTLSADEAAFVVGRRLAQSGAALRDDAAAGVKAGYEYESAADVRVKAQLGT